MREKVHMMAEGSKRPSNPAKTAWRYIAGGNNRALCKRESWGGTFLATDQPASVTCLRCLDKAAQDYLKAARALTAHCDLEEREED